MHPYRENARIEMPDPRAHQRLTIGLTAACAFIAGIGSATAVSTFTRMRELDAWDTRQQNILVVPVKGDSVIVDARSFEDTLRPFNRHEAARSVAEAQASAKKYCHVGQTQGRATITFDPVTGRASNVEIAEVDTNEVSGDARDCLGRVLRGARVSPFPSPEQRVVVSLAKRQSRFRCAPGDPLCSDF